MLSSIKLGPEQLFICNFYRYDCSLKDYINEKKPEVREAILILTQLLEAVAHMIKFGVAHR